MRGARPATFKAISMSVLVSGGSWQEQALRVQFQAFREQRSLNACLLLPVNLDGSRETFDFESSFHTRPVLKCTEAFPAMCFSASLFNTAEPPMVIGR